MKKIHNEVKAILNDTSLDYNDKSEKLSRIMGKEEALKLLDADRVALKEPLKPKTTNMKTLMLSIHKVYFDAILAGVKPIEFRDWTNPYYVNKCSYVENGKRYLTPFDALVLYVGRGDSALTATVALKDITCDGTNLMFHVGKVLYTNSKGYVKNK